MKVKVSYKKIQFLWQRKMFHSIYKTQVYRYYSYTYTKWNSKKKKKKNTIFMDSSNDKTQGNDKIEYMTGTHHIHQRIMSYQVLTKNWNQDVT